MNREELEMCIQAYGKDIYSFCRKLTRSQQEADDLYQDTFLKLVELREKLNIERNPKSYLLSVAVNLWKNKRRKTAWRQRITGTKVSMEDEHVPQVPSKEVPMEEQMISMEEKKLIDRAVRELPEKYRVPVLLFYMEEMKLSEISKILKLPEGTIKSRLYRAKKLLEKELEVLNEEGY